MCLYRYLIEILSLHNAYYSLCFNDEMCNRLLGIKLIMSTVSLHKSCSSQDCNSYVCKVFGTGKFLPHKTRIYDINIWVIWLRHLLSHFNVSSSVLSCMITLTNRCSLGGNFSLNIAIFIKVVTLNKWI